MQNDKDIPVRAKKGVKSKKAVRDEVRGDAITLMQAHAIAAEKLKNISLKSGWTIGKW